MSVNRDEIVSLFQPLFVALRFDFRNAETDEAADHTASRSAERGPAESSHDGSRRDKRPKPWNSQGADACEEAERSAGEPARRDTRSDAFRRLARDHVTDFTSAAGVGQKHGDVGD